MVFVSPRLRHHPLEEHPEDGLWFRTINKRRPHFTLAAYADAACLVDSIDPVSSLGLSLAKHFVLVALQNHYAPEWDSQNRDMLPA